MIDKDNVNINTLIEDFIGNNINMRFNRINVGAGYLNEVYVYYAEYGRETTIYLENIGNAECYLLDKSTNTYKCILVPYDAIQ